MNVTTEDIKAGDVDLLAVARRERFIDQFIDYVSSMSKDDLAIHINAEDLLKRFKVK